MKEISPWKSRYFSELSIQLRQEGFTVGTVTEDLLPVKWADYDLCQVKSNGAILFKDMSSTEMASALNQAAGIVITTSEYLHLCDKAPDLKADSLHDPYKLLADFNGAVLAGIPSKYGVQFVTWQWSYDRASLWQGHFYGNNYAGAKQDFAIRAGLIEKNHLFSDEQLVEVYRCIHETLESSYPITAERQKLLEDAARQIEYGVPRLEELVDQSNQRELEVADEQHQGMTQQL